MGNKTPSAGHRRIGASGAVNTIAVVQPDAQRGAFHFRRSPEASCTPTILIPVIGVKPRVQNISILPLTPCVGSAILAAVEMKTKPTKQAVEAVLDELYPLIREVKIQEEPTRTPPHRDWRDNPKWVRSMWQTIARWHLSKLNTRKP